LRKYALEIYYSILSSHESHIFHPLIIAILRSFEKLKLGRGCGLLCG